MDPLGSLQDEILFTTTPSFGTEELGKPRPGRIGKPQQRAAGGARPAPARVAPAVLPRLPAAARTAPSEEIKSVAKSAIAPKSASPAAPESPSAPSSSSPLPPVSSAEKPSSAPAKTETRQTPVDAVPLSLPDPKRGSPMRSVPEASTRAASEPPVSRASKPAAVPFSSKREDRLSKTSGVAAPSTVPPAVVPAAAAQAVPASKPRPRSSGPSRPARNAAAHVNGAPPKIRTLEDVEDLRRRQNEELMWLIEHEQAREIAREKVLATERHAKRRKQLLATFALEREQAREKLESMRKDAELVLVAHMARLGFVR